MWLVKYLFEYLCFLDPHCGIIDVISREFNLNKDFHVFRNLPSLYSEKLRALLDFLFLVSVLSFFVCSFSTTVRLLASSSSLLLSFSSTGLELGLPSSYLSFSLIKIAAFSPPLLSFLCCCSSSSLELCFLCRKILLDFLLNISISRLNVTKRIKGRTVYGQSKNMQKCCKLT